MIQQVDDATNSERRFVDYDYRQMTMPCKDV